MATLETKLIAFTIVLLAPRPLASATVAVLSLDLLSLGLKGEWVLRNDFLLCLCDKGIRVCLIV